MAYLPCVNRRARKQSFPSENSWHSLTWSGPKRCPGADEMLDVAWEGPRASILDARTGQPVTNAFKGCSFGLPFEHSHLVVRRP